MAPRKRSGTFASDSEGDHKDQDGAAFASSQSPSRKRRRTDSVSSSASDQSSSVNADASTPPSDAGSPKGAEAEDDIDVDAEDAADYLTQRAQGRGHDQNDNSGVLEEVEIVNFMCHKHYMFKLGPRINFICGQNGSGKSAILTAIILCLGGKASATNRGSSLKDLIRQGQDQSSIICRIKNTGDGPYMPEEYGDTIQIERHFSRSGTAGFKLKNARGRVVSTRRADLDDICDHFGFQVENPMSVLSQDLARQFITTSSPTDKYKLFVKGVLLEQLDQDYSIIEQQVGTFNPRIEESKKDLKGLESRAELAKSKAEANQRYEQMLAIWRDWRRQLLWETARRAEAARSEFDQDLQDADKKIEGAEAVVAERDADLEQAVEQHTLAKRSYQEAEAQVQSVNDEKEEEKIKHQEAKKDVAEAHTEQRAIKSNLTDARDRMQAKEKEIEDEMARLAELDGGGGSRRLRELEEAEQATRDIIKEQDAHKAFSLSLQGKVEETVKKFEEAEKEVARQDAEVAQQIQKLRTIRQETSVPDTVFHARMPQLLKDIQRESRFLERPIGPIGKHVKLLKPEWSSILEKSFGGNLNGFVVTSKRDQDLLSSMQQRLGMNVPVLITSSALLDSRPHEPDSSVLTVLRALEIDHPLVKKILIIQHHIENSGLIDDQIEASRVLYGQDGPRPRNLPRCYCFHVKSKTKGYLLSYKGGSQAQEPCAAWTGKPRMRTNVEDQIRIQESILDDMKSQLLDLQDIMRARREAFEKAKQEQVRAKRTTRDLLVAFQSAEERVDNLKMAISDDKVESGNLELMRKDLAEAKQRKELHEGSYVDSAAGLDEKKATLRALTRNLEALDRRIHGLAESVAARREEVQTADQRRVHALNEKNGAVARVDDAKKDRARLQEKRVELDAEVAEATAKASDVSARVNFPENETYEGLIAKYERRQKELQMAQQRMGGTREELEAEKARTATAYAEAKTNIDSLNLLSDTMHDTMHNRRRRWKKFQRFISATARFNFLFLLSEREFRGELILDHKKKTLDLKVEPDITKKSDKGRNANTLSGGEKSFSQICLLLAIWEAMGSPIRCLDEFDVFMDAVNRSLSASLLIEGARKSTGKQFILISPGSKADIPIADDVKTHEVETAERGQTTLTFGAT